MKIGYQGVPGAYSEVATIKFFGEKGYEAIGYDNFRSLIKDLSNNSLDYAVLPIENEDTEKVSDPAMAQLGVARAWTPADMI